ncbi:MAG: hypothetical protein WCP28_18655, partial [Actinomycetes bacterium]
VPATAGLAAARVAGAGLPRRVLPPPWVGPFPRAMGPATRIGQCRTPVIGWHGLWVRVTMARWMPM